MLSNSAFRGAPFTAAQSDWLGGFLSEVFGLNTRASVPQADTRPIPVPAIPDRQHPCLADVLRVRTLTKDGSDKDVRLVAFNLRGSGLRYRAGDSLGVYPENGPELVQAILDLLGAAGTEIVTTPAGERTTARAALTRECDLRQVSDDLLSLLAYSADAVDEAQHLSQLLEDDSAGFLDGRDILDLLEYFPSARPRTVAALIGALAPLQPRLYSISSSPVAYPDEVHLTVGVVRYRRPGCQRLRKGTASTFLTERLDPGQTARIFLQPSHGFRLPERGDTPVIMIGPGTGIAPFRAFLQERQALRARGANWLFFGDQRRDSNYLYQDEIETYLRTGVLTHIDTAFSRDQPEKVYVQHRMLANAARLWEWLEAGAHVYVCGDAQRMARDVDATLQQIVAEQGRRSPADARAYISALARAGHYQRDVY